MGEPIPQGVLQAETYRQRELKVASYYLAQHPDDFTSARVSEFEFQCVPFLGQMWERAKTAPAGWSHSDLIRGQEWEVYAKEIDQLTAPEMFTVRASMGQLEAEVIQASALRTVVSDCRRTIAQIVGEEISREHATASFERAAERLRQCGDDRWTTLAEAMQKVGTDLAAATRGEKQLTVEMPLPTMQNLLNGWRRGRLHMIVAITSGHKTTLARMAAEHVANNGQMAAYITMEDPVEDLAARSIAARGRVNVGDIANATASAADLETIIRVIGETEQQNPQLIMRDESLTLSQCVSRVHEAAARGAVLVAIDFFQLIRPDSGAERDASFWEVAANRLQQAAKQTVVALVLCVQPTQEATKKATTSNYFLGLGDMRGSSAISQAAFGVLSLAFELDDKGKRKHDRIFLVAQKWKQAKPGVPMKFFLSGGYDTIAEWNPPYARQAP